METTGGSEGRRRGFNLKDENALITIDDYGIKAIDKNDENNQIRIFEEHGVTVVEVTEDGWHTSKTVWGEVD